MRWLDLILYKAYSEIKKDMVSTYLGIGWWIIEPLMYMGAFYLIFAVGIRTGSENYTSFLLCGLVPWKWFTSTISQSTTCILTNKGLIQQVYVPKWIFPLICILVNLMKFAVILLLLLIFLWVAGFTPSLTWFWLIPILLTQFILVLGVSMLVAAIVPFMMDVRFLITNGLVLLMFLSGIFFNISDVSSDVRWLFYLNPMVSIIESYRSVLLFNQIPSWPIVSEVLLISSLLCVGGIVLLKRFDRVYPKIMP